MNVLNCELGSKRDDVATEELFETVEEKRMDGWMLSMTGTEGAEGGHITVGQGSAIHMLDDVGLGFMCLVEEDFANVLRQLVLENVAHKPFANVGTAAFITENVTKSRNAGVERATVIVARIAACAENGNNAGIASTKSSCGSEHVALHTDAGSHADNLP